MLNKNYIFPAIILFCGIAINAMAAAPALRDYSAFPLATTQTQGEALLMLAMSKDHQLFYKAYTDYNNLDADPTPETTYKTSIVYDGYFDPMGCYKYVVTTGDGQFERVRSSDANHYCNQTLTAAGQRAFSGNFLNWATMTRMDLIRHVLYGGLRSTDTATTTVLERAHLPNDAHSFAKYYNGADLEKLVPYTIGDTTGAAGRLNLSGSSADVKDVGLTLCNTTLAKSDSLNTLSQDETRPPVVRAARGNFSYWAASERYQCLGWAESDGNPARPASRNNEIIWFASDDTPGNASNSPTLFGGTVYGGSPSLVNYLVDTNVFGANFRAERPGRNFMEDMTVRVKVCDPLVASTAADSGAGDAPEQNSRCVKYGDNRKPEGVLQDFGLASKKKTYFGLITGSFAKNKSGGVLRKNIDSIATEINSDGTFKSGADIADGSIIKFLDGLRVLNWSHGFSANGDNPNGTLNSYLGRAGNNCGSTNWGVGAGKLNNFVDGKCVSWGNPFGEILAESYRYFTGVTSPTTAYVDKTTEESFFTSAEKKVLNSPKDWAANPLRELAANEDAAAKAKANNIAQACPSMNVLGFNASTISYDDDMTSVSLPIGTNGAATSIDVVKITNSIGNLELLEGKNFFVGEVGVASDDGQCSSKVLTKLGTVKGTCPEAPRLKGTYNIAGLAHFARTNDMNKTSRFSTTNHIKTMGVDLVPGIPSIDVIKNGAVAARIVPVCKNASVGGNCAIVDFKIRSQGATSGEYTVVWEDTEQGSDYDQDLLGTITYALVADKLTVTTNILQKSTDDKIGFGYVITGTTSTGLFYTSQVNGFSCSDCSSGLNSAKSKEFDLSTASVNAESLRTPLYYAAKWGGFSGASAADVTSPVGDDYGSVTKKPIGAVSSFISVDKPQELRASLESQIGAEHGGGDVFSGGANVSRAADGIGLAVQSYYMPELKDSAATPSMVKWVGAINGLFTDEQGRLRDDSGAASPGRLASDDSIIQFRIADGKTVFARSTLAGVSQGNALDLSELKPLWSARDQLANVTSATAGIQRVYGTVSSANRYIFTGKHTAGAVNTVITEQVPFIATSQAGSTDTPTFGDATYQKLLDANDPVKVVNYIRGEEFADFRSRSLSFKAGEAKKPWLLGDIVNSQPLLVKGAAENYDLSLGDASYAAFRKAQLARRQVIYVGANDGLLHAFNAGFYNASNNSYSNASGDKSAHALGAELWAYAPYNLLPHLKWLTDPNYSHVFYVDGQLQAFDVKIFGANANSWGTILVGAMRLGGGAYPLDLDDDDTPDQTTRSAIVIFDVTNPEVAPKLLAEISSPDIGFTTTNFAVSRRADNKWYLHFGSGPTTRDFTSDQTAKMFAVDLTSPAFTLSSVDTGETESFVGGVSSQDWNQDGITDALYFGTVGRPAVAATTSKGSLRRLTWATTGMQTSKILNVVDQEFLGVPLTAASSAGEAWVFAGSGSYLTLADNGRTQTNSFYGLLEKFTEEGAVDTTSTLLTTGLKDVTAVKPLDDGRIIDGITSVTRSSFAATVKQQNGWKLTFASNQRNYSSTYVYGLQYLLFDTFAPNAGCGSTGSSYLYLRDFATGLVPAKMLTKIALSETMVQVIDGEKIADGELKVKEVIEGNVHGKTDAGLPIVKPVFPLGEPSSRNSWKEVISR